MRIRKHLRTMRNPLKKTKRKQLELLENPLNVYTLQFAYKPSYKR